MKPSSRLSRGVAVLAAATVTAAAAGTASAAAKPTAALPSSPIAAHRNAFGASPFTSASVAAGVTSGTLAVTWSAPHSLGRVAVFAGSNSKTQPHLVGAGSGNGSLTVTAAYGDWIRLVPASDSPLVLSVRDLGLASDPNLRDAGGYRSSDGQWVRMGAVYRSQALSLTSSDLAAVNALGISDDYDLRTTAEIAQSPDVVPAGATYTNLDVMSGISLTPSLTSASAAQQYMQEIEQYFVTNATARTGFGQLLTGVANSKGAVVFHCTAGKDRTGWATAVLLTLLGVPQSTVMQDYLLSNKYYFDSPAVQAELKAMPSAEAAVYAPMLEVQASYLEAGFAQVTASYGSMYTYAVRGLGVSPQTIAKLRAKLLVG
jgi:protein-tyrosine phosphatase